MIWLNRILGVGRHCWSFKGLVIGLSAVLAGTAAVIARKNAKARIVGAVDFIPVKSVGLRAWPDGYRAD